MFKEDNFADIVGDVRYGFVKNKNSIAEKCIRREQTLLNAKWAAVHANDNLQLIKDLKDAEMLWRLLNMYAISLETLWCMEYEKEDGRMFLEDEEEMLGYSKEIANFYLDETKTIVDKYNLENEYNYKNTL